MRSVRSPPRCRWATGDPARVRDEAAGARARPAGGRDRSLRPPDAETVPDSAGAESTSGFSVPLLQVFDTYIMYEAPEGVVIVDQHSAHERVLYEAVMAQLTGADAPAQRLLLPLTLELTDEELDAVESHGEELRRVGFEAEPFGGRAVVVHAVPVAASALRRRRRASARSIADLARGRFGGWANRLERFAATYACRAAVKAGPAPGRAGDARAAAPPLRDRSAAARRARPVHDRAAAAGGAGAPVWAAVGSRSWSGRPRWERPRSRWRSRPTGRWR